MTPLHGFSALFCLVALVQAKVPAKKRVLVILENEELKSSHALFFDDLQSQGLTLSFKVASEKGAPLERWGDYTYDNLLLFAPAASAFGKRINIREVVDFIDSGRNVMLVGSPELSKRVFDIAAECGVDFEPIGSTVMDHVHSARLASETAPDASLIVVEPEESIRALFDARKSASERRPLLYRGIGHSVPPDHEGITVAVAAHPTSYIWDPAQKLPSNEALLAGRDITLVSLVQTTQNARVTVVGSLEFFSDDLFTTAFYPGRHSSSVGPVLSGNREFSQDLALWTFQSLGVLRPSRPRHFHRLTGETPEMYTIKDPIRFEVDILESTPEGWQPYRADDLQLEYYMMSPYIRTQLQDQGNGTFGVDIIAPDVYGVFKFLVTYHRPGYSNIDLTEMAPIRPFRHSEYERFILAAFPYYASVFSMMIGFWLFGIFYLYHK